MTVLNVGGQLETAPCLAEGPIAASGQGLVESAAALGESAAASVLRAWCVAHLFRQMESLFSSDTEPVGAISRLLETTSEILRKVSASAFTELGPQVAPNQTEPEGLRTVEAVTGDHYGGLFRNFSAASFWDEALALLRTRLERNDVDLDAVQGRSLLDAGCGGGRYTAAWRALGATPAMGVDISEANVADANRRVREAGLTDIRYEVVDVLRLPFKDESFDIVFSNGVLHHTRDWKKGIAELVRLLKTGGLGWLYMIEQPGGLFWDVVEILRVVMHKENRKKARSALEALGLPGNRIFYTLDHVMAPINIRVSPGEIEYRLRQAGACKIVRLTRGADFDRIERIYRGDPFARVKYGVGENRYLFSKA